MPNRNRDSVAKLAVSIGFPNIDKIRFYIAEPEACMSAVRLARGFSGKDKIIKFAGWLHGHSRFIFNFKRVVELLLFGSQ